MCAIQARIILLICTLYAGFSWKFLTKTEINKTCKHTVQKNRLPPVQLSHQLLTHSSPSDTQNAKITESMTLWSRVNIALVLWNLFWMIDDRNKRLTLDWGKNNNNTLDSVVSMFTHRLTLSGMKVQYYSKWNLAVFPNHNMHPWHSKIWEKSVLHFSIWLHFSKCVITQSSRT